MLMPVVSDLHGFASEELVQNCARAHALCLQIGTSEQLFFVVHALAHIHAVRADIVLADRMAAELRQLAGGLSDVHHLIADSVLMRNAVHAGRFVEARRLADKRLPLPAETSPVQLPLSIGADPLVAVRCHYAFACWMLGDTKEARAVARFALERADTYGAPFTLAAALWFSGVIEILCRSPAQARAFADRCATLCAEHGFSYWQTLSSALSGCARVQEGQLPEGIRELEAARTALAATGAMLFRTYVLAFLAEAHLRAGTLTAGLAAVDEGLAVADSTVDRSYWPELWRLKGDLLLAAPAEVTRCKPIPKLPEAERCLRRAVELAQSSRAKSLELRSLISLARARPAQDQCCNRQLRQICAWFVANDSATDNTDVAAARELLGLRGLRE
jgi:predicted ATPase